MDAEKQLVRHYHLRVWRASMRLALRVYDITRSLPDEERYGLSSQMRRSAASVPANIAEGHGRFHRGDFLHHLSIARGSLMELETHILLARGLGYVDRRRSAVFFVRSDEVGRMLSGLSRALRTTTSAPRTPRPAPPR